MWVEDDAQERESVQHRLLRSREDVEYFGDDRAWSADSGRAAPQQQPASLAEPTELAPDQLSAHHLGLRATIKWADERKYAIGTIVAVSADPAAISVRLAGLDAAVSFSREVAPDGLAEPRLFVWI